MKFFRNLIFLTLIFFTSTTLFGLDPALLNTAEAKEAIKKYNSNKNQQSKNKEKKQIILNKKDEVSKNFNNSYSEQKSENKNEIKETIEKSYLESNFNQNNENSNLVIPDIYYKNNKIISSNYEQLIFDIDKKEPHLIQFGYNIFNQDLAISTDTTVPVGDDYILGPGDSLIIHIWGKIDQTIETTIDSNGKIYLPKIGNIYLSGSTFKQSKKLIKNSLEKQYVNFNLSVTMGQLKTIKVFILGEIKNPGAYDISSLSTLFNALHASGGPKKTGSLRSIKLKRNKKTHKIVDLYNYLLFGDNSDDPILRNYDTIFVPPIGDTVAISGEVKRPGIYEIKNKTSLFTLITSLAGGTWKSANTAHIKLNKTNSLNKILQRDIPYNSKQDINKTKKIILTGNDKITVTRSNEKKKNAVSINGEINYPGNYELNSNKTLEKLIQSAGGLLENADTTSINIFRFISKDQRKLIRINNKKNFQKIILNENDIINITSKKYHTVYIEGYVRNPGYYKLLHNMKIYELVGLAIPDENIAPTIEIHRTRINGESEIISININNIKRDINSEDNILLQKNDAIVIRKSVSQLNKIKINISGEITYPGTYFVREGESLASIIDRAGGFTKNAFTSGLQLYRESVKNNEISGIKKFYNQEQKTLLFNPISQSDDINQKTTTALKFLKNQTKNAKGRVIIDSISSLRTIKVKNNDRLIIPTNQSIVTVIGGVQANRGIFYKKGKNANYYINKSGGFSEYANKKKIYIFKANGNVSTNKSNINPGDTIYISQKVKSKNSLSMINETLKIITNILTPIVLINNLSN